MVKHNKKVSKSTYKQTSKRTVNGARRHNTKATSATRKRETESQRLEKTMDKIATSSQFKKAQKLLEQIGTCLSQTREARYNFMATIYCHIGDTFGNDDFEKGAKKYLLRLFPVSKDEEDKKLHQYYRNKYNRALRLLRSNKVSYDNVNKVVKMIEKIGLQSLFNGKESSDTKKVRPVKNFDDVIKDLTKDNGVDGIIRNTLSIAKEKGIDGDYIFWNINGEFHYSTSSNFMKEFAGFRKSFKKSHPSKKK